MQGLALIRVDMASGCKFACVAKVVPDASHPSQLSQDLFVQNVVFP